MSRAVESHIKARPLLLRENYYCLVGGELTAADSGQTFSTLNPATGEKLAEVPEGRRARHRTVPSRPPGKRYPNGGR